MREAERDRRTRPSTPVEPTPSRTYPLSSTTSSTSLSTSVSSAWHSTGRNSADASYLLPLSGSSSSASSSSLAPRASEPSGSRRTNPPSAAQRTLASSASSAHQPALHSARARSSSHSTTLSRPSASKEKYTPQDDEPEAMIFIELLKDASKQVDENSKKKERAVRAKEKGKEREQSLGRSGVDNRTGLDTSNLSARPLTKTSSASAIMSTRAPVKILSASMSAYKHELRGRASAKTDSSSAPAVRLASGKSTPTSLPSPNLNCDLKLAPAYGLPSGTSNISNANHTTARRATFPEPASNDGDTAMDVIDLSETDTEWEKPISGTTLRADTTMYMELDDEDSDNGMDVSFFKPEPPPATRIPAPKSKPQPPQPNSTSRPPAPTQRARTGPPPLGMRRAPQLQPSQYSSSQGSKGVTAPRFKPPLLASAGGTSSKGGSGIKPATTTAGSSRPPPRGGVTKVPVAETAAPASQDADSSFDVSFDVDADALEEAMKAYD
ncbi:hypothetical protein OG21DRAFT_1579948 [Imleria badia]|nr:hypothetical protein OG21DRAFT_1579948 [Imleria badia]